MAIDQIAISNLDLNIWRGDASAGELVSKVSVREGMVVLDAVLWVQAKPGRGPGGALELARLPSVDRARRRSTAFRA